MIALAFAVGSIPQWLTVVALIAGSVAVARYVAVGKAGEAIQVLEAANRVLAGEVERLRARVAELERTHTLEPIIRDVETLRADAVVRGQQVVGLLASIAVAVGVPEENLPGV